MAVPNNLGEEIFLVVCQKEKEILFSAAHTAQWKGLIGNSTVVLIPAPRADYKGSVFQMEGPWQRAFGEAIAHLNTGNT